MPRSPEGMPPQPEQLAQSPSPAPEISSHEPTHSPRELFDAVTEWVELRRELHKTSGESWRQLRKEGIVASLDDFESMLQAIQSGNAGAITERTVETTPQSERATLIKQRLTELEPVVSELKAAPDTVRAETRSIYASTRDFQRIGNELNSLEALEGRLDAEEFRLARTKTGSPTVTREQFSRIQKMRGAVDARRTALESAPETAGHVRLHEILKYKNELATQRFAETPTRREAMHKVQELFEQGKAVLLTGPTGTGKTELLVHLAKRLYKRPPEVVRSSERTGNAEIFGKMGLRAAEGGATETYFQRGRYTTAIDSGTPLVFDEFNLLDPKVRLQLKELYNRRPGDSVTIQEDSGQPHVIQEGFALAATANLKSEKYKERFELDPAETRVFEMQRVDYIPPHELYDLALATLTDKHGSLRMSRRDATETLKNLSDAAKMTQDAFLGVQDAFFKEGSGTKQKYQALEKAVLDPGRVLSMLEGYRVAEAQGRSFQDFLNERLRSFVNQEDFPEKDRKLLLKIFAIKGFFTGYEAKDFAIPGLKDTELKALGVKEHTGTSATTESLPPEAVVALDPYDIRKGKLRALASEFLPEEEKKGGGIPENERSVEFRDLMIIEKRKLQGFFGREIDVPPLPAEVTPERYEKWKQMGFELHYLPVESVTENAAYPGWSKKPGKKHTPNEQWGIEFFDDTNVDASSYNLNGKWVLVDGIEKPNCTDGSQMYQNDPLKATLENLRSNSTINQQSGRPAGSRYGISWEDLRKVQTIGAFERALDLRPGSTNVRLPRALEWNILGNIHHPEWGDTNSWEWFEDSYQNGRGRLIGGYSGSGGLSLVYWFKPVGQRDNIGFRLLVEFS